MSGHFTYSLLKNSFVDKPPQMPDRYLKLYLTTPTIAETLRHKGYHTINVNHGWYAGKQMLLNRGFETYWGTGEANSIDWGPGSSIEKTAGYLKEMSEGKEKFFLLLRSEDLRGVPYRYPIDRAQIKDHRISYKKVDNSFIEVRYQIGEDGQIRGGYSSFQMAGWMSEAQLLEYQLLAKKIYSQQLSFVDEKLGIVFKILQDSKLVDNSIIVLYSNHGDGLYDNKVPNHGVSYQSCVSVPLLIKHPKVRKAISIKAPVALIDLVPTIYDMLSLPKYIATDGESLTPLIYGKKVPRDFFFGVDKESQYIRYKNMKLVVWADRNKELYDLKSDPRELHNIGSQNLDLVSDLDEKLSEYDFLGLSKAIDLFNMFQLERVPHD
jgi:arylsulfatase A-like enzyme